MQSDYSQMQKDNTKAMVKRMRKMMLVQNLGLLATPFSQALRALAMACV